MAFNYTPPTYTLNAGSAEITLRGLNVDDLGYLIERHGELVDLILAPAFDVGEILKRAPGLAADVIACAAEDRAAADRAATLPLGLQLTALLEVWRLSFQEVDMGEALRLFVETMAKRPPRLDS